MNPDLVEEAFYTILHGDATLLALVPGGIWATRPPAGTPLPYLRYNLDPSPVERYTLGGLVITPLDYTFSAVTQGYTKEPARTILARVRTLLQDATLTTDSGKVIYCRRSGFTAGDMSEERDGVLYQMCRASYHIEALP